MIIIQCKDTGLVWKYRTIQGFNYVWPNTETAIHYWEELNSSKWDVQDRWEVVDLNAAQPVVKEGEQ